MLETAARIMCRLMVVLFVLFVAGEIHRAIVFRFFS